MCLKMKRTSKSNRKLKLKLHLATQIYDHERLNVYDYKMNNHHQNANGLICNALKGLIK